MNQKRFKNIFVFFAVVLTALVGYLTLIRKSQEIPAPSLQQPKQIESPPENSQGSGDTNAEPKVYRSEIEPKWFTYQSQKPLYSIKYPREFNLQKYGDEKISIGGPLITLENNKNMITLSIDPLLENPTPSFESWAKNQAMLLCSSDAPGSKTHCDRITKMSLFETSSGNEGYEMYMNLISEIYNYSSTEAEVGPVFIFDVSDKNQLTEGLIIHMPLRQMSSQDIDIIRSIVKTLTF